MHKICKMASIIRTLPINKIIGSIEDGPVISRRHDWKKPFIKNYLSTYLINFPKSRNDHRKNYHLVLLRHNSLPFPKLMTFPPSLKFSSTLSTLYVFLLFCCLSPRFRILWWLRYDQNHDQNLQRKIIPFTRFSCTHHSTPTSNTLLHPTTCW